MSMRLFGIYRVLNQTTVYGDSEVILSLKDNIEDANECVKELKEVEKDVDFKIKKVLVEDGDITPYE